MLRKKQSGIAFLPRYRFFTAAGIVDKNNDYSKSCCEKNRVVPLFYRGTAFLPPLDLLWRYADPYSVVGPTVIRTTGAGNPGNL